MKHEHLASRSELVFLPPGPDLPAEAQVQQWIEGPTEFWQTCALRFGEVFTVQLGSLGPVVVLWRPSAVREVFQLPPEAYTCAEYNEHYKFLMGGNSLLLADGRQHGRLRKQQGSQFRQEALLPTQPAIAAIAQRAIDGLPKSEPCDIRRAMHQLALEVILEVIFGTSDNPAKATLRDLFATKIYHDLGAWSSWNRISRLQPTIREIVAGEVQRRGSTNAGDACLINLMLKPQTPDVTPASEIEIQDQVLTLLVAGVDPAAIACCWALFWISESPDTQSRLADELAAGDSGNDYLDAVCRETLRMYPIVSTPSGRRLTHEATIDGRKYAAGTILLPCTYLVHRRGEIFPEPARFQPERFLSKQFAPYEYFPFGGGSRYCLGAALALLEMQVVLSTLLSSVKFEPAHSGPVTPVRHGTLLAPSDAMRFVIRQK